MVADGLTELTDIKNWVSHPAYAETDWAETEIVFSKKGPL